MKAFIATLLLCVACGVQAGALSRTFQILELLEESGNVEQAINITTYCSASASDDEIHYYKALLSHLKANTWESILTDAQAQVGEFGFSFQLAPRRALIADFTVEILTGIGPNNLEERILAANDLAILLPDAKVFHYLVQEFTKIRRALTERKALEAEVEAQSVEVAKMRARLKGASGRADWQQDGFIKMTIAQEKLTQMRKSINELEPISRKFEIVIANVRKHLAKAGVSGDY